MQPWLLAVRLGRMLCYSVSLLAGASFFGINGPLATLSVNVIGSAVMGLLAGLVAGGFDTAGGVACLFRGRPAGCADHIFQLRPGC